MSRIDIIANRSEFFTYDNLNRLTKSTVIKEDWLAGTSTFVMPPTEITYDAGGKGNFEEKSDVGSYLTHGSNNQVIGVTNSSALIPSIAQNITYTPFLKTEKVTEGNKELSFVYGPDRERRLSTYKVAGAVQETRYYGEDGYEKYTGNTGTVRQMHYIIGGDGVCAVMLSDGGRETAYYLYKDHLGSWLTLTSATGSVYAQQSFDAWGGAEGIPQTGLSFYPPVPIWLKMTGRGYTGHEHHDAFGLINMNARMYDPLLGRMCAPDNLLHPQYGTQGFNRYSYALNNPLKYTDPDGENPFLVAVGIGALIGAATYTASVAASTGGFTNWSWSQFTFSTFSGALSGAFTFGIGSAFGSTATTLSIGAITNEVGRAAAHGYAGFVFGRMNGNGSGGFWAGATSSLAGSFGANIPLLKTGVGSAAFASAIGGTSSAIAGGNFWQGAVMGLSVDLLNQKFHKEDGNSKGKGNKFRGGPKKDRDRDMTKYPEKFRRWYEEHNNKKWYKIPGQQDPDLEPIYKEWRDLGEPTKFITPREMLRHLQRWDKAPKPTPLPLPVPAIIPFNDNLMRFVLPERYDYLQG